MLPYFVCLPSGHADKVSAVKFSPDGSKLVSGSIVFFKFFFIFLKISSTSGPKRLLLKMLIEFFLFL